MKKMISVILVTALMLSVFVPCIAMAEESSAVATETTERKSSTWAEEYIKRADSLDWVLFDDMTQNITRGEFCRIAEQFLYSAGLNMTFFSMETPFTDIGEGYSGETGAIKYLYCLNIVEGKSETLFCPDDLITREEAAVIITRIIDAFSMWEIANIKSDALTDFAYIDHAEISSWAVNAVYDVSNLGVMHGTDKGFEPKSNLTREQSVAMLIRLYDMRWSIQPSMFSDKMNFLMNKDENYVFSPLSIKMALMLAANGADEDTQEEICEFFDESSVESYNEDAKEMIDDYTESEYLCANVSNSVWVNSGMTNADFTDEFRQNAQEFYAADIGKVDDGNAVETINDWVDEKTKGKIDSILPDDYTDFYLTLVNAIYFNGKWENKFDQDDTKPDMFTNADGTVVETDFMNQTDTFNYYDDGTTQIVEMPYEILFESSDLEEDDEILLDLDVSMYIVMSEENINVEEKIWYTRQGYDMRSRRVRLSIPKFEVEYSESFKENLSQLGLGKIFEEVCFDTILENEPLFVDDILHKTYIKVNENGTEAAAVAAVILSGMGKPAEPVEFKADKPFYFVIRDNISEEILFMGRYAFAK